MMFESLILLSLSVVLGASSTDDRVNERFTATRDYYEAQWKIYCPKEVADGVADPQTVSLCLVLDARFDQNQTCNWWHTKNSKYIEPETAQLLSDACAKTQTVE